MPIYKGSQLVVGFQQFSMKDPIHGHYKLDMSDTLFLNYSKYCLVIALDLGKCMNINPSKNAYLQHSEQVLNF